MVKKKKERKKENHLQTSFAYSAIADTVQIQQFGDIYE